jgi:hypothetical protein
MYFCIGTKEQYDPIIARLSKSQKSVSNDAFDGLQEDYIELKKKEWAEKKKAMKLEEESKNNKAAKYRVSINPTEKSFMSENLNE